MSEPPECGRGALALRRFKEEAEIPHMVHSPHPLLGPTLFTSGDMRCGCHSSLMYRCLYTTVVMVDLPAREGVAPMQPAVKDD